MGLDRPDGRKERTNKRMNEDKKGMDKKNEKKVFF